MSALRLLLTAAALLWGIQYLVFRDGWRAWLTKYGTKGALAERFWRVSPYVFAGVSFWCAALMLTTGLFGTYK
jgi:hypothetical protein